MVIGHNPGLHDSARLLIASGDVEARERLNEGLPTAALAVIDFAGENWRKLHARGGRLERFVTPALAGGGRPRLSERTPTRGGTLPCTSISWFRSISPMPSSPSPRSPPR